MAMRLADDEATIILATRCFVLRPSLRAAFRLERKYEGFQKLSQAIADGNFSACADLIETACADPKSWIVYIATARTAPVSEVLSARDQLLDFVLALSGAKPNKGDAQAQAGDPMTFEEYHTKLFQIGTGWLGWMPEATWSATPAEIINAQIGRREMLTAIFGGKRDDTETVDAQNGLDSGARAQLNALGDLGVVSVPRAR
jgi:hypothetical protein